MIENEWFSRTFIAGRWRCKSPVSRTLSLARKRRATRALPGRRRGTNSLVAFLHSAGGPSQAARWLPCKACTASTYGLCRRKRRIWCVFALTCRSSVSMSAVSHDVLFNNPPPSGRYFEAYQRKPLNFDR